MCIIDIAFRNEILSTTIDRSSLMATFHKVSTMLNFQMQKYEISGLDNIISYIVKSVDW